MTVWSETHTPIKHKSYEECGPWPGHCMFCDGGLSACEVCGSFEGATTTHCPGYDMYLERGEDVYAGKIDFRDGEWVEKCSPHSPRYWTTPEGLAEIERQR